MAGRNLLDDCCMRGLPAATGEEVMLDPRARYWWYILRIQVHEKSCAGHDGGERRYDRQLGIALVLWNQNLSNEEGDQSGKIYRCKAIRKFRNYRRKKGKIWTNTDE